MDDFKAYILSSRIANEKSAAFYVYWIRDFYRYYSKDPDDAVTQKVVSSDLSAPLRVSNKSLNPTNSPGWSGRKRPTIQLNLQVSSHIMFLGYLNEENISSFNPMPPLSNFHSKCR